ncbi:hypothetical protein [Modestobacter sp. KNN46-3]|jgi:hypothetical protein|uniref:hypothetical protein n=1 Tax=Modestobacter sp. KNN46-3 TaxID=2711218 RepID=UPI0013DFD52A|nr:hypothetical protein [Modestobacter sp. KNN46-3]
MLSYSGFTARPGMAASNGRGARAADRTRPVRDVPALDADQMREVDWLMVGELHR